MFVQGQESVGESHKTCGSNELSGVEAAETGESDAQGHDSECSANDGTVGVAHYVTAYPTGGRGEESM
jgi:hypothetical protein